MLLNIHLKRETNGKKGNLSSWNKHKKLGEVKNSKSLLYYVYQFNYIILNFNKKILSNKSYFISVANCSPIIVIILKLLYYARSFG
jgi:hypothetical protein